MVAPARTGGAARPLVEGRVASRPHDDGRSLACRAGTGPIRRRRRVVTVTGSPRSGGRRRGRCARRPRGSRSPSRRRRRTCRRALDLVAPALGAPSPRHRTPGGRSRSGRARCRVDVVVAVERDQELVARTRATAAGSSSRSASRLGRRRAPRW